MDKKAKPTTDFYHLVAWVHARQKRLIWISALVLIVIAFFSFAVWQHNYQETAAAEALSPLKVPAGFQGRVSAADAGPFLQLADKYTPTAAGARAMLLAGGILFEAGSFPQARAQFERLLQTHPDFPLASHAAIGVAACLEGEGRLAEAATRYQDLLQRHGSEPLAFQLKSGLARVNAAQNKTEEAFRLYDEMARVNNNDSWTGEARIRREELAASHPNLIKPAPAAAPTLNLTPLTIPGKP